MKRLIFVDCTGRISKEDRHAEMQERLDANSIKTFNYAFELKAYLIENPLQKGDIIFLHKTNPTNSEQNHRNEEASAYSNKVIENLALSCACYVPVFEHTGGDVSGHVSIDKTPVVFSYYWLLNHIKELMDGWDNCKEIKDYISVIESILNKNLIAERFAPLDILIQGYLTIHDAAEKPDKGISSIGKINAKQSFNTIQNDPYAWFEPAVAGLKELFSPEVPDSNEKLNKALEKLPDSKKLLITSALLKTCAGESELVRLSKFIMHIYAIKEFGDDNRSQKNDMMQEMKKCMRVEFMKKAHQIYEGICL